MVTVFEDVARFNKVNEPNPSYEAPEEEKAECFKLVRNARSVERCGNRGN